MNGTHLKNKNSTVCQKSDKRQIDTKKELAKIAGVSHDTIHKVELIKEKGSDEQKKNLDEGKVP
jgi:DNA-binding XRE family transcriptional regulator